MPMTWKDAAILVMRDVPEGLHYAEITNRIIDRKLISDFGATPAASLNTALTLDMNQFGEASIFERIRRGTYRLRPGVKLPPVASPPAVDGGAGLGQVPGDDDDIDYGFINAYGMYWDRELVDWNGRPPELMGKQTNATIAVNFAGQDGVYLLYNNEKVIYAGKASSASLFDRLRIHTQDRLQQRWNRFSWFGVKAVDGEGHLLDARTQGLSSDDLVATLEALLIEAVEPPQNRQAGKGFGAIEFYQVASEKMIINRAKRILSQG